MSDREKAKSFRELSPSEWLKMKALPEMRRLYVYMICSFNKPHLSMLPVGPDRCPKPSREGPERRFSEKFRNVRSSREKFREKFWREGSRPLST
jgi:hypothetical protein